jgi:cobalt-zinc-cadmium efflux system outer membrane protein
MMPRIAWVVASMALITGSAGAQQPAPEFGLPLTLQQLEEMALANNPTMRQAEAGVEAARGRSRQAGAWPNPVIGYIGEEISPGDIIRWGEHGAFVEQTIVLGGKLRLNRAVFEREIARAESLVDVQQQRVLTSVRSLFYDVLSTERRVDVLERLAQLAAEAVDISRQLFNTGAADRPDVLESEIEARRTRLELTESKNHLHRVRQQLAAMAGDQTIAIRRLVGSIDTAIPELEHDTTLRTLLDRSPEMRAVRAASERARAVVARARRETFPDLFLRGGLAYNRELLEEVAAGARRPVGWEALAEAGVSIPLFNRNRGGIAAARAEEARAEAERRRVELDLQSRLATVFDEYLTALRASEVYRDEVVPRADEAYRLYLARYREMAAAFPQVVVAQRTLFQMSVEYLDNLEDAWRAALRLQGFLAGEGLEAPARAGEETEMGMRINRGGER